MGVRRRTVTWVAAATGLLTAAASLGAAAPSQAAARRTVTTLHVSVSAVTGSLPAGAGVTVIQTCPVGSDLDRALTREAGEAHDPHLRVTGREYWPAGVVTRYRVRTALHGADELAVSAGIVVCRLHVGSTARSVSGRAVTDVRVWGPAPSRVGLVNATVMGTFDLAHPESLRTTVRGTGVGSSPGSLRHAVSAVQDTLNTGDVGGVVAVGVTRRPVVRGRFVSMENRYRFRISL